MPLLTPGTADPPPPSPARPQSSRQWQLLRNGLFSRAHTRTMQQCKGRRFSQQEFMYLQCEVVMGIGIGVMPHRFHSWISVVIP